MEERKKPVKFGTRDAAYLDWGCGTPGCEYVLVFVIGFLVCGHLLKYFGRSALWSIAVPIALILLMRLFFRIRLRVDPTGLTIGAKFRTRFIPWASIRRAEYPGPAEGGSGFIWVGEERVRLPGWVDEFWDVKAMLWKYLRHYAECPPPKRQRKAKKPATDGAGGEE